MKVWIIKIEGIHGVQWHETDQTWDERWIGACYQTKEQAEAASVIAAATSPNCLGRIKVGEFTVAASDYWLAVMRKKRAGKT